MSRPSVAPAWASTLSTDPSSGQQNRVQPSDAKRAAGFDLNEKPTRQDINWTLWNFSDWLNYFAAYVSQGLNTSDSPTFTGLSVFTAHISTAEIQGLYGPAGAGIVEVRSPLVLKNGSSAVASLDPVTGTFDMTVLSIQGTDYAHGTAELNTLTSGGSSDLLHLHNVLKDADSGHPILKVGDVGAGQKIILDNLGMTGDITLHGGALKMLTDGSVADTQHTHVGVNTYGGKAMNSSDIQALPGATNPSVINLSANMPSHLVDLSKANKLVVQASGIYEIEAAADVYYDTSEGYFATLAVYKGENPLNRDGAYPAPLEMPFPSASFGILRYFHQTSRAFITLNEEDILSLRGFYTYGASGMAHVWNATLLLKRLA